MKSLLIRCCLAAIFAVAWGTHAWAADFEPGLNDYLLKAKPDEKICVIVKLYNPRDIRSLDLDLHNRKATIAQRHREVIEALQANARDTQGPILNRLYVWQLQGKVDSYQSFWIENLIVLTAPASIILELADDPAVESIGSNPHVELISPIHARGHGSRPSTLDYERTTRGQNATGATRINRELGLSGQGILVAEIDTGVDGTHPALASRWRGQTAPWYHCWLDLVSATPTHAPFDPVTAKHGTHTMGTICGREIRTNGDTITVGAAPMAQWIECNAINQGVGANFISDILVAFQWLTDPDSNLQTMNDVPDVIQNSWGVTSSMSGIGTPCYANWNTVILNCEAAGPVITWSAGNEGTQGAHSLRSPATFELNPYQIFSVGAVDASSSLTPPYPIANFSSLGPSNCAPNPTAIKPEISAPGVEVYSTVPGGGYDSVQWDGTSMAGPHVAGIVALMRQACHECDYITIKQALLNTAIDYGTPGEDNTYGFGFINGYAAVTAVSTLGRVIGTVTTTGGAPLARASVQAVGQLNTAITDTNGHYSLAVQAGTFDIRFSKFGYGAITAPNVAIQQHDTVHINEQLVPVTTSTLVGTVMLQSGAGVPYAKVYFYNTPLDTIIADAHGRFSLALPISDYTIRIKFNLAINPPQTVVKDTTVSVLAGDTTFAPLPVYVALAEPSAADNFGYRAYDWQDRGVPTAVNWQEIRPFEGGPGTLFEFAGADSNVFLPTPWPIRFYGAASETLTVNPNGWMLPGIHHDISSVNTPIPQNLPTQPDPPGIIAAMWDDLRFGLGEEQCTYLDSANGKWIIEFRDYRPYAASSSLRLNWQVQFLDPAFYPSLTGESQFAFVYGKIDYIGGATIGIENPEETTGLQVMFNGTRNTTTWPVDSGAVILFSTGQPLRTGHIAGYVYFFPPLEVAGSMRIGGQEVAITPDAHCIGESIAVGNHISFVLTTPDYQPVRYDDLVVNAPPAEASQFQVRSWRIDPPQELSASQFNGTITLRWHRPISIAYFYYPNMRYTVYRNGQLVSDNVSDTTFADGPFEDRTTQIYAVEARYRYGGAARSGDLNVQVDLAAKDLHANLPHEFALHPAYPNPFNPETRLRLDIPSSVVGTLAIYDLNGRLVRTLSSGAFTPGYHEYVWNGANDQGKNVATGMYLCRIASDRFTAVQKLLLVR